MQKFMCIGNLGRDVEKRETASGKSVASFSVAVKRPFSDTTDFFNVTVWNTQADYCAKYLKKGSKVGIVGYIQNRTYEDKDGNKRTVTEIIAEEVELLFAKREDKEEVKEKPRQIQLEEVEEENFDLPF